MAASANAALAGDAVPGSTEAIASLPSSDKDFLLPADDKSNLAMQPQADLHNGLDFFSVRPEVKSGDFTSLLGSSTGGGGLKLHLNW